MRMISKNTGLINTVAGVLLTLVCGAIITFMGFLLKEVRGNTLEIAALKERVTSLWIEVRSMT